MLGYIFKEALRGLNRTRGTVALSATTIALALLIFGIFLSATVNVRRAIHLLQEKVELEIYLEDSITTDQVEGLLDRIEGVDGVMEAVYISKEAALREAQLDTVLLNAVGTNPLPASIRVRMREGYRSAAGVATIVRAIENDPGIEEIASGRQWAQQLDRFVLILSLTTAAIGIIFGLASVLVISNTVQLTIFSRRETIDIMHLIGAKESFIRGPFIIEGIIQGVTGGILAAAGLSALHWAAQQKLTQLLPLGPKTLLALIVLGGLLGGLGSNLSVGKFLRTQTIP